MMDKLKKLLKKFGISLPENRKISSKNYILVRDFSERFFKNKKEIQVDSINPRKCKKDL